MRKFLLIVAVLCLTVLYHSATAFAQSSGSFSASYNPTQCAITDSTGTLSGGTGGTSLPDVTVKVSSGSGVALVITPSLVTGLYTNNKLSSSQTISTQNVGLRVKVTVDGDTTNVVPEVVSGSDGVIYDQRFMQVNASFLSGLTTCTDTCFSIVESTLSAHSFNFYISNLTPGTHKIGVSWDIVGGTNGEATCVGPGTVTVQQVKNFSFNSGISF